MTKDVSPTPEIQKARPSTLGHISTPELRWIMHRARGELKSLIRATLDERDDLHESRRLLREDLERSLQKQAA